MAFGRPRAPKSLATMTGCWPMRIPSTWPAPPRSFQSPGTGKNDRKWVANADWQSWVRDVQTTALAIRAAAKAKDPAKFSAAADHLSEVCQSCHTKYRPQTPSDGVARYPFYPKRELAK